MISFLIGILVGVLLVLIIVGLYLFYPIDNPKYSLLVSDQFPPIRIPAVLARFLDSNDENIGGSKWESCYTFSIIAHFLFQEFKDTRRFRRWVYKRLQLELNDLTTRSTAGLLIQDVRIRDLSIGSEFPVISKVRIESYRMSEDGHSFEELNLLFNLEYTGGLQTSIDVALILNRRAQLSLKLVHLAGKVRLTLSRKPYSHWSFTFIKTPVIDFKVGSEWQGRQVKYVIPIITQQFRRILQRKHVYPNYKIRYRPFFPNPLFIPSPPMEAFAHIKIAGGLEVTVLQCTRLNISLASPDHTDTYCTISLDKRPFLSSTSCHSDHCFTVLINFVRHGPSDPLGLTFSKSVAELGLHAVKITSVKSGSTAKKCGFQIGDIILAVNNVPIRSERQATKILCGTAGELNVLVERRLVDQIFASNEKGMMKEGLDDFILVGENSHEDVGLRLESIMGEEEKTVDEDDDEIFEAAKSRNSTTSSVGLGIMAVAAEALGTGGNSTNLYESCSKMTTADSELVHLVQQPAFSVLSNQLGVETNCGRVRKTRSTTAISSKMAKNENAVTQSFPSRNEPSFIDDIFMTSLTSKSEEILPVEDAPLYKAPSTGCLSTGTDIVNDTVDVKKALFTAETKSDLHEESVETSANTVNNKEVEKPSKRHRFRAKAFEMAVAGKAKVSDFWYRKKDPTSTQLFTEQSAVSAATATAAIGEVVQESPATVVEVKKGRKTREVSMKSLEIHTDRQRQNSEQSIESSKTDAESCVTDEQPTPRCRSTKRLQLNEDVLWGQSLHFALEEGSSRYLNVTVHSAAKLPSDKASGLVDGVHNSKPCLLGYTSIYIPQIIDDCQLTLSNCHREVFTLRPPPDPLMKVPRRPSVDEASRHAGFDARLCYGDVLLSFRYFPSGLPPEANLGSEFGTSDDENFESEHTSLEEDKTSPTVSVSLNDDIVLPQHNFEPFTLKTAATCAICNGKVWLKSASRCSLCFIICHNKCVAKHLVVTPCVRNKVYHDDGFEVLENASVGNKQSTSNSDATLCNEMPANVTVPLLESPLILSSSSITTITSPSTMTSSTLQLPLHHVEGHQQSRRRRIAERVSEKISSWGRMTHRNVPASPTKFDSRVKDGVGDYAGVENNVILVESVIPDVFAQLNLSGSLCEMRYQPGNAYNEEMISAAKNTGKDIFVNLEPLERKDMINRHISTIKAIIDKTTAERMKLLKNSEGTAAEDNAEFAALDNRLQALAVLMLHYCSALQNCNEKEENSTSEKLSSDLLLESS